MIVEFFGENIQFIDEIWIKICDQKLLLLTFYVKSYLKALFFSPDLQHSITVDVKIGTICEGNFEIFFATLNNILAPFR